VKLIFPIRQPLVIGPGVLAVFAGCYLVFVSMAGVAMPGRLKNLLRR
jgi:hypothetical protein